MRYKFLHFARTAGLNFKTSLGKLYRRREEQSIYHASHLLTLTQTDLKYRVIILPDVQALPREEHIPGQPR